ncbi:MAG: hypothetical protein MUF07_06460 [Steroidobacteraceae bacterium]|jgi:hypothetical protein|nr:hypothetical protein [Steroidobacteraceae bacterium]
MIETERLTRRLALLTLAALGALASTARPGEPSPAPERDRAAIRAMAGEYRVTFEFTEVAALRAGYETRPSKRSGGTELVLLVEDAPTRLVLQHLLLDTRRGEVVKHWRQDWSWQGAAIDEFQGGRTWRRRALPEAEVEGRWVQSVYEVDDSPRYASHGRWEHRGATSEWVSESTWRPLPRREHTTRDDYDVLVGINRHIVTPWGWVHAQDNTKLDLRRDTEEPLVAREVGTNTYRRIGDVDFGPARAYWQRTADYWAAVRAGWEARLGTAAEVTVDLDAGGRPVMHQLLALAEDPALDAEGRRRRAAALIEGAARPLPSTAAR